MARILIVLLIFCSWQPLLFAQLAEEQVLPLLEASAAQFASRSNFALRLDLRYATGSGAIKEESGFFLKSDSLNVTAYSGDSRIQFLMYPDYSVQINRQSQSVVIYPSVQVPSSYSSKGRIDSLSNIIRNLIKGGNVVLKWSSESNSQRIFMLAYSGNTNYDSVQVAFNKARPELEQVVYYIKPALRSQVKNFPYTKISVDYNWVSIGSILDRYTIRREQVFEVQGSRPKLVGNFSSYRLLIN